MAKKKTYRVSGKQPVVVDGASYQPEDVFEAVPGEVDFLVGIGALKESTATPDAKKD